MQEIVDFILVAGKAQGRDSQSRTWDWRVTRTPPSTAGNSLFCAFRWRAHCRSNIDIKPCDRMLWSMTSARMRIPVTPCSLSKAAGRSANRAEMAAVTTDLRDAARTREEKPACAVARVRGGRSRRPYSQHAVDGEAGAAQPSHNGRAGGRKALSTSALSARVGWPIQSGMAGRMGVLEGAHSGGGGPPEAKSNGLFGE